MKFKFFTLPYWSDLLSNTKYQNGIMCGNDGEEPSYY